MANDANTLAQDLTPETVKGYYDALRNEAPGEVPGADEPGDDRIAIPARWTEQDFNVAHGYVRKVAQASTLEQFDQFLRTGVSIVPVKMTPAEMEVMMGGGPGANWIGAIGAMATIGAMAAACGDPQ